MEKQKLLWVIFSIALLLVVVVGAGFLWFFPSEKKYVREDGAAVKDENAAALSGRDLGFDPVEWVRKSEEFPGLEETADEEPGDFVIVYGETEVQDIREEKSPEIEETAVEVTGPPKRNEISAEKREPSRQGPAAAIRQEPVQVKPKTPKQVRVTEYWIQAGSYTSKYRAEQMRDKLSVKGVTSRITSKEVNGTNYFRVRIGPYKNKNEAEKFLGWIHAVQGFESSYVSQVYVTRNLN